MNEISLLLTLAGIHMVALMSPGPDFALIVQNTSHYGRRTGLNIAAGLACGILIHSILSITGISIIVHQHPLLFSLLQLCGGSYLLWLGISACRAVYRALTTHKAETSTLDTAKQSHNLRLLSHQQQAFSKGLMTNLLNPKALVFFMSLMSSLVPASMSLNGKISAVIILATLALLWFSTLAWLFSTKALQRRLAQAAIYIDGVCGIIFSLLGAIIVIQATSTFLS